MLTLLLLVSAFAISTSASDRELEVSSKTVLFDDGSLVLCYDVLASNVADGESLKMYFWKSQPQEDASPDYVVEGGAEISIGGESYFTFYSKPLRHQDMRLPIYSAAVITNESGEVVAKSEIEPFSLFDYTIKLFDAGLSDQIALYTTLLEYGAAMQRALYASGAYTAAELTASGGYSNEYCKVVLETYVDGVFAESSASYYAPKSSFTLSADKTYNGAIFDGFKDEKGSALLEYGENTSPTHNHYGAFVTTPGTTVYKKNYKSYSYGVTSYDERTDITTYGLDVSGQNTRYNTPLEITLTTDKKGVASTTKVTNTAYVSLTTRGTEKYLSFDKCIKATTATTYPAGYTGSTSGAYKVGDTVSTTTVENTGLYIKNQNKCADAAYHIFEADILLISANNTTTTQLSFLGEDSTAYWSINFTPKSSTKMTVSVNGGVDNNTVINENITVPHKDWFNLRVEYYPLADDTMEVKIYIDGQYTGATFTSPTSVSAMSGGKDSVLDRIYFYHLNAAKNVKLAIDNLILTSVPK